MDGLRANPHVGFNHEKTMDKIQDTFSVFKDKKGARKGNHDGEIPDDGVDFSVPEDEEPPKPPETEEQREAPEYEDMIDGPLPAKGLGAGQKYLGKPRFPWAAVWAPPTSLCFGLQGKKGVAHRCSFDGGEFTTVTRVVAATAEGNAKVIISYLREALSMKESQLDEPWKSSDAREKMLLMKLRVLESPAQLAAFGWNAMQRHEIPPDQDRDFYFPQYVPVRERCSGPVFCVTWVRKVSSFREIPTAVKADPPPLSTGLLFGTSIKELADPYNLFPEWDDEGSGPDRAGGTSTRHLRENALCVQGSNAIGCCHVVHVSTG